MDKMAFLKAAAEIDYQIAVLEQQKKDLRAKYLEGFPKVGDPVLYEGDQHHVCKVEFYGDGTVVFDLRKPKKDGTPSNSGRIKYSIQLEQITPIEVTA